MQRIRLSFALLALFLLVPLALLLDRTLSSLERERDQRHQAVASRVFDEAERTLTEFLEEEENRPPEHYFSRLQNGQASPLSQPPTQPFVIDYFQFDAAGRLLSPIPERSALLGSRLKGLTQARSKKEFALREQASAVTDSLEKMKAPLDRKRRSDLQPPGTTKAVQKLDLLERSEAVTSDDESRGSAEGETEESYSSYQILEQLNRAGRSRAKKIAAAPQRKAPATSRMAAASAPMNELVAGAVRSEVMQFRRQVEFKDADALEAQVRDPREALSNSWSLSDLQSQLQPLPTPKMESFEVDDQHLILYRATKIAGRGDFQQGLLLDLDRLADWIETGVVVESGLSRYIEFDLVPFERLADLQYRGLPRFIYDHRFAEPFESLGARVSLSSLPDTGGSTNIYIMGFLLIAVSTIGLWAMYRRVAVAVHFAERRSNFAAAVSHELKTPLTAIRMYAEMLRDGMVPDEAKRLEYYGTITSEAERLTRLINNVLEFSNLENRTRRLEIRSARVEASLRDVIHILEPHAHSRGFQISLEIDPDLPAVQFEADALQQILFNLIDNALKYAESAQRKEIDVTAQATDSGVRIRVRDFGAGVAKEHRAHLFELFYRGESELTRRTKGTGIGLALVKGLAEQMGGEIQARNAVDGGFEVELLLRSQLD